MVCVFAVFATGSIILLQQLGIGLAAAILIDATIVRAVLLPASMMLLGDRNWYLPRWLEWLPDLDSGEPADRPNAARGVAGTRTNCLNPIGAVPSSRGDGPISRSEEPDDQLEQRIKINQRSEREARPSSLTRHFR